MSLGKNSVIEKYFFFDERFQKLLRIIFSNKFSKIMGMEFDFEFLKIFWDTHLENRPETLRLNALVFFSSYRGLLAHRKFSGKLKDHYNFVCKTAYWLKTRVLTEFLLESNHIFHQLVNIIGYEMKILTTL